jgi:hypothetical protein
LLAKLGLSPEGKNTDGVYLITGCQVEYLDISYRRLEKTA